MQTSRSTPAVQPEPAQRLTGPPLVVVLPCTSADPALAEQLGALRSQDHEGRWDLVVAANADVDRVRTLVAGTVGELPTGTVRVLDVSQRTGKAYAVNTAVAAVPDEPDQVLVLLDADDVVDAGYLRAVAAAAPEHQVMGARLDATRLNPPWVRARRDPLQEEGLEVLLDHQPAVVGAGLSLTRKAFDAAGGFDQRMHRQQDVDLVWRLQYLGMQPAFVPDAVVHYRYRHDVRGIWRQEVAYGANEALLYRLHRERGAPRRPWRRTVGGWARVLTSLPTATSRAGRMRLVTLAGAAVGRVRGSIRYRVLYL